MADNNSRNAFLIHLAAYAVINAGLVALNAMQAVEPGEARNWWSIWVVAGWGIGVLAHGFAVWIESRSHDNSLLADEDARGVAVHLFVYLAVNAFLILVNLKSSPDNLWSIWPLLGWGAGLGAHAWLAYRKILTKTVQRYATEQEILTQMQLERQASEIAATIDEQPRTKKAPAKRRRQTAKKTTKRAAARKGTGTAKRTAAKRSSTTTLKTAAKAKKAAAKKPAAKKPASRTRKKPTSTSRAKS